MKCFVKRTLSGWEPYDWQAEAIHKRGKAGDVYRADIVRPRNYAHHCLFMSLMELTFANQEQYTDDWAFRTAVAEKAGHVKQYITLEGKVQYVPLRYSYDDIPDEGDFTVEFGKAMTVCAHIMHDMDLAELEAEVGRYADEHYGRAT